MVKVRNRIRKIVIKVINCSFNTAVRYRNGAINCSPVWCFNGNG